MQLKTFQTCLSNKNYMVKTLIGPEHVTDQLELCRFAPGGFC